MLNTNSVTLRGVVHASFSLQPRLSTCWTAQGLNAFQGLRGCESMNKLFKLSMLFPCKILLRIGFFDFEGITYPTTLKKEGKLKEKWQQEGPVG